MHQDCTTWLPKTEGRRVVKRHEGSDSMAAVNAPSLRVRRLALPGNGTRYCPQLKSRPLSRCGCRVRSRGESQRPDGFPGPSGVSTGCENLRSAGSCAMNAVRVVNSNVPFFKAGAWADCTWRRTTNSARGGNIKAAADIPHVPLSMSAAQITAFTAIYPRNCRPARPPGERILCGG